MKKKNFLLLMLFNLIIVASFAQLGKCKGKYLGNITAYSVPSNYTSLWNQTTSENGSKWGTCDRGSGRYDFSNSDLAYNTAKNSGGLFKFHALIWGAQAPGYLQTADATTIVTAIRNWYQAVEDHYTPMGGLKFIDVLNEPVNTPINREIPNLKAALTQGYQSEPANQNDRNNPYGWAIWPFQLARKHFPDAILLINEFNTEHNWNNCRAEYITMSNAIKNAPNLTDGKKNLIDGIGLQAHGMNGDLVLSQAAFKACIDEIWNKTGLPLHITELDLVVVPNEAAQRDKLREFFTVAWEHPHVAGVTFWGYIEGSTWISGSGMQTSSLVDRPSMTWLKQYMASQPDLACCPDPWPFGDCKNGLPPVVDITAPTELNYIAPATVTVVANATDSDGTIAKVEFYVNGELKTSKTGSPYSYELSNLAKGKYEVKAVAYDNNDNTDDDIIVISVNNPKGPYGGTAHPIPGKIEIEHYDEGGNGVAYNDATEGNEGGADFRMDEDVDLENCTDNGGGYNLGWSTAGEWLEYTVNVASSGLYNLTLRAACNGDDRTVSLSDGNGTALKQNIAIPNTADWQGWVDVLVEDVQLNAGQQVLRLTIGATDYVNINYMTFETAFSLPTVAITAPQNNAVFTTRDAITVSATASATDASVTKVDIKVDGSLKATDATSPYSFDLGSLTEGVHEIEAVVTDSNGLTSSTTISVTIEPAAEFVTLKKGWNLIGCPLTGSTAIQTALSSIWSEVSSVKNLDSFYLAGQDEFLNTLKQMEWGQGYLIYVNNACELTW